MRVAFLHPIKLDDHFFVEQHEVAIASELTALGHRAELVDFLFERDQSEAQQIDQLRTLLHERAYDVIFLRQAWSTELSKAVASTTKHLVGWQSRDLLDQGVADVAVLHVSRFAVRSLLDALEHGRDLLGLTGLAVRDGGTIDERPPTETYRTYEELSGVALDPSLRITLSSRGPNPHRAVVVSNTGCAYRNIPNRTGTFDGLTLPDGVKTAGCTFCSVSPYEKMTEEQALELLETQIDAELRHRPKVREIAIKDDFALRFLGKLGARLTAWSERTGISLAERTTLLSARPDYLLTYKDAIEAALAGGFPGPLGFYLLGYENFSDAELLRFHKGMTGAEIERALELMDEWAARFPDRFVISPTSGFILFTPWTTLEDLRINADVMRRRGFSRFRGRALLSQLRLHPEQPLFHLAQRDGLLEATREDPNESDAYRRGYRMDAPWRFADPKVAKVHAAVLAESALADDALFEVFEEALDEAAGQARGKNKRPLRMVRAPNDKRGGGARTQQITVASSCNQRCGFCTYVERGKGNGETLQARADRVAGEVRDAASQGAERIVLTGAEPLGQPYVLSLARLAKNHGAQQVEVETNATVLGRALMEDAAKGEAIIERMKEVGITRFRVALNAVTAAASDAITGDVGGFDRTVRAIAGLRDAHVAVELAVALVPANRGELAHVCDWAARETTRVDGAPPIEVVARWIHTARAGYPVLSPSDAQAELVSAATQASALGVTLRMAPGSELPPCVFPDPAGMLPLLRLHASLVEKEARAAPADRRHVRAAACDGCSAAKVCPGPSKDTAVVLGPWLRTLAADALSEQATRSTVRERQLREYKSDLSSGNASGSHERRILRLVFHCNQACDFCFVSRELPPIEHERLVAEIEDCAANGIAIDFSGGEPTLHPNVLEYIRLAKEKGAPRVELQTNAIKMADRAFAKSLRESGLSSAFVSLHGTSAAVSDRVTAAPGTFDKTVRGIANLIAEGVPVQVNFVVCGANAGELAGYPDFIHEHFVAPFPDGARIGITLSYAAASTDNVPRDGRLIPRISAIAPHFETAIARAAHHAIPVDGLDTKCGVPACYLPRAVREVAFAHPLPPDERARSAAGFTRAEPCTRCDYGDRCYGIRSSYAEIHGTDELRAIKDGRIVPRGSSAGDHPSGHDAFVQIGLSPHHRLRASSRARLHLPTLELAAPTLVEEVPAVARERVQLDVGIRSLMKVERSHRASAEAVAETHRALGYRARVFLGAPGPSGYPRAIAFVAKDEAVLDEAFAIESGLTQDRLSRADGVRAMGRLLGYPSCCAAAFADHSEQNDATWLSRLSRQHVVDHAGQSLLPLTNWVAPELRLFSHFPCQPRCEPTLELATHTFDALLAVQPAYAERLHRVLCSVGVAMASDRYLLLEAPEGEGRGITEPGAAYDYGRVWSAPRIGMDSSRRDDLLVRAFELEVVEALAEGDRVMRTPHALAVYRAGRLISEVAFAADAPRLLDFRGRRQLPRLRVLA
jgi:MoaA/NifB/PqqE/SkfB family radical SAM enzyme